MNDISMKIRDKIKKVAIQKGYNYNARGVVSDIANEICERYPTVLRQKKGDLEPKPYERSYNSTRMTLNNFFKTEKPYTSETLNLICDFLEISAIHLEFKMKL